MEKNYLHIMNSNESAATEERKESRFWSWAILIVFILFCLMSLANTGQEWLNHHQGWNGARRSLEAKNYHRYGYIDSKLGSMDNLGEHYNADGKADKYEYFWHHPPMTNILVSFAFGLFGESPAVARLLAACLSWLTFIFLFLALKRLWGREATFYSLFFLSFIPIYCTYLNFVNHETVVIFAMSGMVLCYERFISTGSRIYATLIFILMFIGTFTDFPMFPFLFFFWLFTGIARLSRSPRRYGFHIMYVFIVALTLAIVVLHLASMQDSVNDFYKLFLSRHEIPGGKSVPLKVLLEHWDFYYAFFSPIAYLFSFIYLVDLLRRMWKGQLNRGDAYVLSFCGAGLMYILPLKPASFIHEYTVIYLAPFFALSSGFAMRRIREWLYSFNRAFAFGVVVIFLLALVAYTTPKFFVKAANPIYKYFLNMDAMDNPLKYDYELEYNIIASMLRVNSRPEDLVLVSMGRRIRREFHYYIDRRFKSVKNPGDFLTYKKTGNYSRYLVHGSEISSNFLGYLTSEYNFINYGHFYIFDLHGDWKHCTVKRKVLHSQSLAQRYFTSMVHNSYDIVDDPAASLNLSIYWNKKKSIEYWHAQASQFPDGLESGIADYNYKYMNSLDASISNVMDFLKPPRKEKKIDRVDYRGYAIRDLADGRSELTLVFSGSERIEGSYQLVINGKPAYGDGLISRPVILPVPTDHWQPGLLYAVRSIIDLKYGLYDISFEFKRKDKYTVLNMRDGFNDFGINCNRLSDEQWKVLDRLTAQIDSPESRMLKTENMFSILETSASDISFNHQALGNGIETLGCFSRSSNEKDMENEYDLRIFIRKVGTVERNLDLVYMHTDRNARVTKKKPDAGKYSKTLLEADEISRAVDGQTLQVDAVVHGDPSYGGPRLQLIGEEPAILRTNKGRSRVHITVGRMGIRQPFAWIQNLDISRGVDVEKKKD